MHKLEIKTVSKKQTHHVSFFRTRRNENTAPSDFTIETVSFSFVSFKEGKGYVAIYPPIEGNLAGVGKTREEAVHDFAEGFLAVLDFHANKNSDTEFLSKYFKLEQSVSTVEVEVKSGSVEAAMQAYPSYRTTPDQQIHAQAA